MLSEYFGSDATFGLQKKILPIYSNRIISDFCDGGFKIQLDLFTNHAQRLARRSADHQHTYFKLYDRYDDGRIVCNDFCYCN